MFLSSHTLSEVERVAHRVAILRRGRLVVVDSLERLREIAIRGSRSSSPAAAAGRGRSRAPRRSRGHVEGTRLDVAFEGSVDPLIKALAAYEVRALRSRDDDLEEIFLHYYRDGEVG